MHRGSRPIEDHVPPRISSHRGPRITHPTASPEATASHRGQHCLGDHVLARTRSHRGARIRKASPPLPLLRRKQPRSIEGHIASGITPYRGPRPTGDHVLPLIGRPRLHALLPSWQITHVPPGTTSHRGSRSIRRLCLHPYCFRRYLAPFPVVDEPLPSITRGPRPTGDRILRILHPTWDHIPPGALAGAHTGSADVSPRQPRWRIQFLVLFATRDSHRLTYLAHHDPAATRNVDMSAKPRTGFAIDVWAS